MPATGNQNNMKTVPVYEAYRVTVDEVKSYHKSLKLAVANLIERSCDICHEPWGGLAVGKVFEHYYFSIDYVEYVIDENKDKVVIKHRLILSFKKDWSDNENPLHFYGSLRQDINLIKRIGKGMRRRWNRGWKKVEVHRIQ
jgi:hypothetical protein